MDAGQTLRIRFSVDTSQLNRLNNARQQFSRMQQDINRTSDRLHDFQVHADQASRNMGNMASSTRSVNQSMQTMGNRVREAGNRIQAMASNTGNAVSNIQAVGTVSQESAKKVSALGSALKMVVAAISVKALYSFGKDCIELGSDLSEVQNVVNTVFPNLNSQINSFAQNAANQFGLSETMAKKYASTFGAMATSMGLSEKSAYDMSTALTGLAGDVASFYNISQDEAYTKLKSVFTGETESLKELGVVMTQTNLNAYAMANGWGTTVDQMTQAQQVMLRFSYVTDVLNKASGDFAKTSGSWANQTRLLSLQFQSLKANLGQAFINVLTPVIQALNALMSKLVQATAFVRDFFASLTGGSSSSSSPKGLTMDMPTADTSSGATDLGQTAADGLASGADSSKDINNNLGKAAKNAKKTKEEIQGMASTDQINKLSKIGSDGSDSGSGAGGAGGIGGLGGLGGINSGSVDTSGFDKVNDAVDKMLDKLKGLRDFFNKLKKLFLAGLQIGLGPDFMNTINGIKNNLLSIGKTLKEIFTDPGVLKAAQECFGKIAFALGEVVGSIARIGANIAYNLTSGIAQSLEGNKERIKQCIINLFSNLGDIAIDLGWIATMIANISDAFKGPDAVAITKNIADIFTVGFTDAITLVSNLTRDIVHTIAKIISDNQAGIKTALENCFKIGNNLTSGFKDAFTQVADGLVSTYNQYIKPAIERIGSLISKAIQTVLFAFNKYIAPALEKISKKISDMWSKHLAPFVKKVQKAIGNVVHYITILWEETLSPVFTTIVTTVVPMISSAVTSLVNIVINVVNTIMDSVGGLIDMFSGLITFLKGVFTGDWNTAWQGLQDAFKGFTDSFDGIVNGIVQIIKDLFSDSVNFIKSCFEGLTNFFIGVWNGINGVFKNAAKVIGGAFTSAVSAIKKAWGGMAKFFSGVWDGINKALTPATKALTAIFSKAWDGVKKIWNAATKFFSGVWEGIKRIFSVTEKTIGGFFSKAWNAVKSVWNKAKGFFEGIWNAIKKALEPATTVIGNFFSKAWNAVKKIWNGAKNFFSGVWNGIKNVFSKVKDWFKNVFSKAFNAAKGAWSGAKSAFSNIWGKIKSAFSGVKDWFGNCFGGALDAVKNKVNGMVDAVKQAVQKIKNAWNNSVGSFSLDIPDWVPGIGGSSWGFPKFAKGGVVDEPTIGMFGEAGKEVVMPLENNTGWITELGTTVASIVSANGGTGNGSSGDVNLQVEVKLGGNTFAKQTIKAINSYQKQIGKVVLEV